MPIHVELERARGVRYRVRLPGCASRQASSPGMVTSYFHLFAPVFSKVTVSTWDAPSESYTSIGRENATPRLLGADASRFRSSVNSEVGLAAFKVPTGRMISPIAVFVFSLPVLGSMDVHPCTRSPVLFNRLPERSDLEIAGPRIHHVVLSIFDDEKAVALYRRIEQPRTGLDGALRELPDR